MEPTSSQQEPSKNQKAADILRNGRQKIQTVWEKRVRELVPESEGKSSIQMLNTLHLFLNELILKIEKNESSKTGGNYKGMSQQHGGERATFRGYFLPDLLKEFSILRQVINEELYSQGVLTNQIRSIIDESIDTVISSAVTEFATVQRKGIQDALTDAEASNRALEEFAAVAAHDLKSPLATISSYLDLLKEDINSPEALEYIETMKKASERMMSLIDSLLNYSRLATPTKEFKPVEINDVLKSVTQNLEKLIQETSTKINYQDLPRVLGDADLLSQLFQNLISNSIKFRGKNPPEININAEESGSMWRFSVQDNGIGFDPKFKTEIFKLYQKLHGTDTYQGTGIGLATCRRVVEFHGGKIWADSVPGSGATFSFTLPMSVEN